MLKRNVTKILFLIALLTIALYGCSGNKENTNEENTPADENQSSAEPTYGGSVTVGITQDLDSLDPHKAVAAGTKEVLFNIFEGLVKFDKDGNLVPAVAERYEISTDGMEYTFTLRDGVKFHNGNPVTTDDIVYSIKRSAGMLTPVDPLVVVESALSVISEVTAVDEKTVKITLSKADTELLSYLTCAIIPADYDALDTKPVGTGPFQFVSYTPLESIVMEKNEDYYVEGVPYLDQVTFKMSANTDAAFLELSAGSIDILPYLTDAQAAQMPTGYHLEAGSMNLIQGMFLNNGVEPFNNPTVRKALSYAIDRQAIIDMVGGGRGDVIGTNMFPGFKKYYNADLDTYYNYDIEKAKALLAEAGYPDGFTFTVTVPSNYQFHVDTAQVIVEQLKQIGVTAEIQLIEWASWLSDVYAGRNYQATVVGLAAEVAPRKALERFQSDADNNFLNYKNEEFDHIYGLGENTTDENEKIDYYKQMQTLLTEDAVAIYIQDPYQLTAVSDKLGGYTYYPIYVQDMSLVYHKGE
ncbi:MAG: transporter substrate-binding protein [Herbinix sp.]|jgi:peptide/nickel transport system substrate-binding protein|nr:transporter substrate-binding protein [Herbinix sp.]